MTIYQRILVPIDGSETSGLGQAEAIRLASVTGGTLRFFHVIDDLSFALALDAYAGHPGEWLASLRRDGRRLLDEAVKAAEASGVKAEGVLHESLKDKFAQAVANEADRWAADLVVVGTHGRRGVSRLVMGSGAQAVLHAVQAPVLLVRLPAPAKVQDEAPERVSVSLVTGAFSFE